VSASPAAAIAAHQALACRKQPSRHGIRLKGLGMPGEICEGVSAVPAAGVPHAQKQEALRSAAEASMLAMPRAVLADLDRGSHVPSEAATGAMMSMVEQAMHRVKERQDYSEALERWAACTCSFERSPLGHMKV
jgi:hypothetical protein